MRTLLIDIETYPNLSWTWGLWKQDISLAMLEKPGGVLGFSVKWHGSGDGPFFFGLEKYSSEELAAILHDCLDEADVVEHFNGKKFDVPWINSQILTLTDLGPPSPFHQVDWCNVVKKEFRFPSNKLQYVSTVLGFAGKEETGGFQLWKDVMQGTVYPFESEPLDTAAWTKMGTYCNGDVRKLDEIHDPLLPWAKGYPNRRLYGEDTGCPRCGAEDTLQSRGYRTTKTSVYQRMWCSGCKGWSSVGKRERGTAVS